MRALYVLPFLIVGIVNAQWGWEEEMRERSFTLPVSTTTQLTTTLATNLIALYTNFDRDVDYHAFDTGFDHSRYHNGQDRDCECFDFYIAASDYG
jgi:hypothetical protein